MRPPLFEDPRIRDWTAGFLAARLPDARVGDLEFTLPATGTRTPVAIAALGDGRKVVVRLIQAWRQALRIARNTRRLGALGLPVPRLLTWSGAGRLGPARSWVLVEECLDGAPFTELKDDPRPGDMALLGRTLARLHSVHRRLAGRLALPWPRAYVLRYLPRALERVDKLEQRMNPGLEPRRADDLRRQLQARARDIGGRRHYELLHGHINSGNLVVGADACWLVDLDAVRFGDFAQDLVRARHRLTAEVPERQRALLDAYFAACDGPDTPTRQEFARLQPFYEADYQVSRALNLCRRRQAGDLGSDAPGVPFEQQIERHVDAALAALATDAPESR